MLGSCLSYHFTLRALQGLQFLQQSLIYRGILSTYQHPFRLLRLGSGAPGLLGRGIAPQLEDAARARQLEGAPTRRRKKQDSKQPQIRMDGKSSMQTSLSRSNHDSHSQSAQVTVGSLFALATVSTPRGDETIINKTPTTSRQGHRGMQRDVPKRIRS